MTDDDYADRVFDTESLTTFLQEAVGPAEEVEFERHSGGHSNETVFVTWGDDDLVVRMPPPAETTDTAHDVLREYRIMDALQGTEIPVPRTLAACDDADVVGRDFYVMERERGDVYRDDEVDRFATPADRRRAGEALIDTLADIHQVDYEAVGLGDLGRPEGFVSRQVDRWREQLDWATDETDRERSVPELHEVTEWLVDRVPEDHPHALVHGDYKFDNVMFGPQSTPTITSVFDWEMSTLGDPRTDLGWLLSYWWEPEDVTPEIPELSMTYMTREGYPSRAELVERYEDRTGISFDHQRFYRTLAVYKLAVLGEMFFRRHLTGDTDDPLHPKMRSGVPQLAARAKRIIDGSEPL